MLPKESAFVFGILVQSLNIFVTTQVSNRLAKGEETS